MANASSDLSITRTAKRIAAQLSRQLDRHAASGDAFVVSVYGEWGIGKTYCLRDIQSLFDTRLSSAIESLDEIAAQRIVVPVFFDAWQYEHEEHPVVPLLKTIELALDRVADRAQKDRPDNPNTKRFAKSMREAGNVFGDVAISLLSGFKFKFAPLEPIFGIGIELSGKDAIEAAHKADEKRTESAAKRVFGSKRLGRLLGARQAESEADAQATKIEGSAAKFESLYFNVRAELEKLTEYQDGGMSLRLVVLIDDLDRCLPEKAIQVLESVKLFLNVPGFSFVLAVDDEVVERGIAHRYRDYTSGNAGDGQGINAPISGAEYLEKVVHLPVHLPRWTRDEARQFLETICPLLFFADFDQETPDGSASRRQTGSRSTSQMGGPPLTSGKDAPAAQVLELVLDSIPLVPRKLIRLAEALEFERLHFNDLDSMDLWHPLHSTRVVALQQLYPELYRHLRLRANRYWRLFRLRRNDFGEPTMETGESLHDLNQQWAERGKGEVRQAPTSQTDTLRENRTLLELVERAAYRRGNPDPLTLFAIGRDEMERSPDSIRAGLTFDHFAQLYFNGVRPALGDDARARAGAAPGHVAIVAEPDVLLDKLLETDALARREYLETSKLHGRLSDAMFQQILQATSGRRALLVDIEWLRDISRLTTPDQLLSLYRNNHVLAAILGDAKGADDNAG